MIKKEQAPVEWAMLMYELDDAREHLKTMMDEMNTDTEYDEESFRVNMGHIFSHLNRAWNNRNLIGELGYDEWYEASKFPTDLEPT